jgi:shikimate dehydrogenase
MVKITGSTQILGVIGYPIEHSLSPVMHNAALAALAQQADQETLPYVYVPLPIAPAVLPTAIAGLAAIACQGFNLTIPHKQAIMPLLQEVSEIARTVGAVNTVWLTPRGWAGTNTDVQGFLAPLQTEGRNWTGATVTILGSGGAARAVIAGCAQLGCAQIAVVGRSPAKLQQLQDSFGAVRPPIPLDIYDWDALSHLLPQTDLLVNTTPIGMYPHAEASPVRAVDLAFLPGTAIVYDLIYTPNPTLFLKQAQAQGRMGINGLEMLVQQGAAALEIWLGQPAPVEIMRQAAQHQLDLEQG